MYRMKKEPELLKLAFGLTYVQAPDRISEKDYSIAKMILEYCLEFLNKAREKTIEEQQGER